MQPGGRRAVRVEEFPSETLRETRPLDWMLPVGPRNFAAQSRGGEDLAWIAEAAGIERAAQALHRVEIVLAEHLRHVRFLVGADAMFAGDGATGVDAVLKDFRRDCFGMLCLAGNRFVVADERMKIAVAGVKHIADP